MKFPENLVTAWASFLEISCNGDFLDPFFKKMDFSKYTNIDFPTIEQSFFPKITFLSFGPKIYTIYYEN